MRPCPITLDGRSKFGVLPQKKHKAGQCGSLPVSHNGKINYKRSGRKLRVSLAAQGLFHFSWNIGGGGRSSTTGLYRPIAALEVMCIRFPPASCRAAIKPLMRLKKWQRSNADRDCVQHVVEGCFVWYLILMGFRSLRDHTRRVFHTGSYRLRGNFCRLDESMFSRRLSCLCWRKLQLQPTQKPFSARLPRHTS